MTQNIQDIEATLSRSEMKVFDLLYTRDAALTLGEIARETGLTEDQARIASLSLATEGTAWTEGNLVGLNEPNDENPSLASYVHYC